MHYIKQFNCSLWLTKQSIKDADDVSLIYSFVLEIRSHMQLRIVIFKETT